MDRTSIVTTVLSLSAAWLTLCGAASASPPAANAAPATATPAEDTATPADAAADAENRLNVYQQPADEPLTPLVPRRTRSAEEQKRLDALARYMTGELFLERDKPEAGMKELERAIELNPAAIAPYRLYVPTAVREGKTDQARQYALLATQHAPDGVQLLRALVAVLIQGNQIPEAIKALQEGIALEGLQAGSFESLILQRHLAQCYQIEQQKDEAAQTYQKLLADLRLADLDKLGADQRKQLLGDKGTLYDEMGTAFLEAKLPEPAVEAFEEAAKLNHNAPGIHGYNLAMVFQQTGKTERALEELDKYLAAQLSDKGRAPYQLLKELLGALNRGDELVPRLEELKLRDKRNKFLAFYLADEYVAAGKLADAKEIFSGTSRGNAPEALVGLSMIHRREGDFEAWLKTAGRAFELLQLANPGVLLKLSPELQELAERFTDDATELAKSPEQLDKLLPLAKQKSEGNEPSLDFNEAWLVARIAAEAERSEDAARLYRYAIGMQNLPSYQLYRELGAHFIDVKQYKEAEQAFQDAADHPSLEPARSFFLSLVSVARELDGRIEAALEAIGEARRLTPEESQFALQEARIYYRARRWDEAIREFEAIIQEFAADKEFVRDCRFSLSAIYVQQGDHDRGEQILLDVLKEEPEHPQANNDLGYLWADRNVNLEKAEGMVRKALAAEPENAAYLDSLGWVLYRLGKYEEAVTHLEKAASLPRGEDPTIFDHLGDCFDKLGKKDQAIEQWRKALKFEEEKSLPDPKMVESLKRKLPAEGAEEKPADDKPKDDNPKEEKPTE
jgi:tetratricopeptide (TPR) repeat protein